MTTEATVTPDPTRADEHEGGADEGGGGDSHPWMQSPDRL